MIISKVLRYAFSIMIGCVLAPAIASAQAAGPDLCEGPTGPGTGLLTLPDDLCCYSTMIPDNLARRVIQRDDFGLILLHMSESCPELALALNDFATEAAFTLVNAASQEENSGPGHCEFAASACNPTPPPEEPGEESEEESDSGSEDEAASGSEDDSPQID